MDTAISRATLQRVSEGELPETLRIHRPGRVVAFGPRDRVEEGFRLAVEAAARLGFGAVERLAGGRAAVFHEGTVAFSWAVPDPSPREGIRRRFGEMAAIMADALRSLRVDARIGEIPGEYCPGEHSVNAGGRTKLMGVGQRVVSGGAHVGGVVVVHDADAVRDVLIPVNRALDLSWDPTTVGAVEQEVPGVTWDRVEEAVLDAFRELYELEEGRLDPETLTLAAGLADRHRVG
jgi:octanoyl-[GcvH]:protein N-octanoyltransferase